MRDSLAAATDPTTGHHVLAGAGQYLHWGVVQISLANLLIIAIMAVIFVLALVLPFPNGHDDATVGPGAGPGEATRDERD